MKIQDVPMQISDYLLKSGIRAPGGSRTLQALIQANAGRTSPFMNILSACQQAGQRSQSQVATGLTISDYLSKPIMSSIFDKALIQQAQHQVETPATSSNRADSTAAGEVPGAAGKKQSVAPAGRPDRQEIDRCIAQAAQKYDLAPHILKAVIKAESGFRADAVSRAGAKGLMQLMPGTAKEMGVENPFDIEQNIDGGAKYLNKMLKLFKGNLKLALAAYNAGPGTIRRYNGVPPYKETNQYIARVLKFSERYA